MEYPIEIQKELDEIKKMSHEHMCRIWRFGVYGKKDYLKSNTVIGDAFKERLWEHFGGFTPEISKQIGW
jgi:hypothetical protein